ncbi:MAG: hypothetical protein IPP69_05465 [Flavobacteriales bacterium]|nr:hypothetical protein [Flavobacteriales bacterium]
MLDNLINLVKEHAGDAIINNPAIPNERNDEAIQSAAGGIMDHLKGITSGGGLDAITGLFNQGGNDAGHPEISNISSSVAGGLMEKFGLDSAQAGGIAQKLIPVVMNKLINKTNDPNDSSFDLNGIVGSLTGGGASGLLNNVKNLFG